MNNFILMAKILRAPELRYTKENQTPITDIMVQYEGRVPEDNYILKVTGWGNLATEIKEKYREGDQVIVEGRLAMNTYDTPDGYKEKRAELVAARLYRIEGNLSSTAVDSLSALQKKLSPSTNINQKHKNPVEATRTQFVPTLPQAAKRNRP